MKLHAKNIALSIGIPNSVVGKAVEYMIQKKSLTK